MRQKGNCPELPRITEADHFLCHEDKEDNSGESGKNVKQAAKRLFKRGLRSLGYEIRHLSQGPLVSVKDALLALHREKPFRTILDVGANIGQTAEEYSRWFPGAVIHSIEPGSRAFALLCETAKKYPGIRPHRLALGETMGEETLFLNRASYTNSLLPAAEHIGALLTDGCCETVGCEPVPVCTLPGFCTAHGIDTIGLLKMDVQGFEDRILRGAGGWLAPERVRVAYLEVLFTEHYRNQADFGGIYSLMARRGYKLYALFETAARPDLGYLWGNALFVPKGSQIAGTEVS